MRILENKIRVLICGLLIFSLGIPGIFNGIHKANADDFYDDFSSGMLVIDVEDESLIPEGGEIVGNLDSTYLVDYEDPESARLAFLEIQDVPEIAASPESVFVVTSLENDLKKDVPKETKGSLLCAVNERGDSFYGMDAIALIDTGGNEDTLCNISLLEEDGLDRNGHGKKMIDAMKSVDEEAKIISIKAVNDKGIGSISSVYSAIRLAIDLKVKVINLSLVAKSTLENEIISLAVSDAIRENIIVVAAAGNFGEDAINYVPANIPGVITVGSCDENGVIRDFSNFGDCVNWNVNSKSTSEGSAKLSSFIARYCEPDENLTSILLANEGNGLIYSKDYVKKQEEKEEVLEGEWKEFDVSNLTAAQKESICGDADANITGFSFNEEEEMAIIETSRGAVPENGDFVTSAKAGPWTYCTLSIKNKVKIGSGSSVSELAAMTSSPVYGSNKYTMNGRPSLQNNYTVVSFAITYTPGSLETGADARAVGVDLATSRSLGYASRYEYDAENQMTEVRSGSFTPIYSNSGYVQGYTAWFDKESTAAYMYRMCIWNYINTEKPMLEKIQHGWMLNNLESYRYEENKVGSAKSQIFGTHGEKIIRIDVAPMLRDYDLIYQIGDKKTVVETGLVGSITNIKNLEKTAQTTLSPRQKVVWDYSGLPFTPDSNGDLKMIPNKDMPTDTSNYNRYQFVVQGLSTPKGSVKINVKASETNKPLAGVTFKITSPRGLLDLDSDTFTTDATGSVLIEHLDWENSVETGSHDGRYEITATKLPAGFDSMRPISIDIDENNYNDTIVVDRTLDTLWRPLSVETAFINPNVRDGIFIYKITGNNVAGTPQEYTVVSSNDATINVKAGQYSVVPIGKNNYNLNEIVGSPGVTFSSEFKNASINIADYDGASIRFVWDGNAEDGYNGDLKTNEFRK